MGRNKVIDDGDLLAAARDVFRAEGHAAATRDIARAAGVSQAALYQRFGTKDELFFQAMTPEPFDLAATLGPYPPKDALKDLQAIAARLVIHLRAFMPTMLMVLAAPNVDPERLREWHAQLPFPAVIRALAERLRRLRADELIGPVNPDAAAVVFMSMLHSYALFADLRKSDDDSLQRWTLADLVRVFWKGLEP